MRAVLIVLALLAAAKVWTQDRLFREASGEALLAAYQQHAIAACRTRPPTDARGMPVVVGTVDWSKPESAEILIGNPEISVPFWQVDNPLWAARYKSAFVRLTIGDRLSRLACDYDVAAGSAKISIL